MRWILLIALLSTVLCTSTATAQSRLQAQAPGHAEPIQGIGQRRQNNDRFQYQANEAGGRRFEQSFNMTTNAQFSAHNIDNVSERLVGESLYNNPWYWQNVGSLDTELMTSGSGAAIATPGINGGYYNPFFYDQWQTTDGLRHSGRMSAGGLQASRDALESTQGFERRMPGPRGAVAAPTQNLMGAGVLNQSRVTSNANTGLSDDRMYAQNTLLQPEQQAFVNSGELATSSLLKGHRLSSVLQSGIDDYGDGRIERQMGRGMSQDQQPLRYMGSAMRGISTTTAQLGVYDHGLTSYDLARIRGDRMAGRTLVIPGSVWDTQFRDLQQQPQPIGQENQIPGEVTGPMSPSMATVPGLRGTYQAMAERYKSFHPSSMTKQDQLDALDRDYRRLRGDLISGGRTTGSGLRVLPGETDTVAVPSQAPTEPGQQPPPDEGVIKPLETATSPLPWDDYGLLLRHGQRVTSYAARNHTRFDDLVVAGQNALIEGDYFLAERRFARALRFVHGQPLATAGEGHAQLGAGLYLSSALTLQSLLGFQPEMIDVTYDRRLLPSQESLDNAISELISRLRFKADLDRYGFLLAYIGHQLDRPKMMRQGLDAMRQGGSDETFVSLLEEVWLETGDAQGAPVPLETLKEVQPAG